MSLLLCIHRFTNVIIPDTLPSPCLSSSLLSYLSWGPTADLSARMEVALSAPQTLSEPLRRGTPLPLSQLVEESRSRANVPNRLLESSTSETLWYDAFILSLDFDVEKPAFSVLQKAHYVSLIVFFPLQKPMPNWKATAWSKQSPRCCTSVGLSWEMITWRSWWGKHFLIYLPHFPFTGYIGQLIWVI